MTSLLKSPKINLPKQEEVEDVKVVEEDEEEVKRRKRQQYATQGRQSNIISGIQSALKKRLGE